LQIRKLKRYLLINFKVFLSIVKFGFRNELLQLHLKCKFKLFLCLVWFRWFIYNGSICPAILLKEWRILARPENGRFRKDCVYNLSLINYIFFLVIYIKKSFPAQLWSHKLYACYLFCLCCGLLGCSLDCCIHK
jgi:hypothetical protein